jgi:hypothetical protein
VISRYLNKGAETMKGHRITLALAALTTSLLAGLTVSTGASAATAPYCGITWGSLQKSVLQYSGAPITGARVGRHDCWDRLVIDLGGASAPGYNVRYVDAFRNQDTGAVVPVSGGAVLMITAHASTCCDALGHNTVPWTFGTHIVTPSQFTSGGYRTFRDLVYGGSYEGSTDFALGVRARLPFRVFTLTGPGATSRLVIDTAHQW